MSRGPVGRKRPLWVSFGAIGVGILLFFFAASGGFEVGGLSLRVESSGAQILLSALGIVFLAGGVLLLADERNGGTNTPAWRSTGKLGDYQIKMLRPTRYHRKMEIEGGYLNQPEDGALRLFTMTEEGAFRPQSIVKFDDATRRWSGKVDLGSGPYYSVYVIVALVDSPGILLWNYYYQVGRKTDWEPISGRFRDYAVECDRFLVEGVIDD